MMGMRDKDKVDEYEKDLLEYYWMSFSCVLADSTTPGGPLCQSFEMDESWHEDMGKNKDKGQRLRYGWGGPIAQYRW